MNKFEELVGTCIGDYVIDAFAGAGGQAVVYRAHSQPAGLTCALRVFGLIDRTSPNLSAALSEARKQSIVDHPAIVKVFSPGIDEVEFHGEARRVLFLPMSFSPLGSSEAASSFAGRPLTELDYKSILNLLDGLQHIHDVGLLHGDIKPANILRFHERLDGEDREVLRLTDFGIAKVLSQLGGPGEEVSGVTPAFMPPERLDNVHSERGDIYSMGATLYYLIAGELPISPALEDDHVFGWQRAHQAHPRPNARAQNIYCPPRLALLIMRMMNVDPAERPSLDECINELRVLGQLLHGQLFEFRIPPHLQRALDSDTFPVHSRPAFKGIFKPEVHEACGTSLYVVRFNMPSASLEHYKRLVRCVARQLADSFSMYECWGAYDVHLLLWSDANEVHKVVRTIVDAFPGANPQFAVASHVHHFHQTNRVAISPDSVLTLAIQEGVSIAGFDPSTYLCGSYPDQPPTRSVRAFVYIEVVGDLEHPMFRRAIVEHVRARLSNVWHDSRGIVRRMSILELAPDASSPELRPTVALVDFVATEYEHLPAIPTAIIETLGEGVVRTLVCVETRRVMIQSDRIRL